MSIFLDIKKEWPKIYQRVKKAKWFDTIANYYATQMSFDINKGNYKTTPIIKILNLDKKSNPETKLVLEGATSPEKAEWWITPFDCYCINGFFLFIILSYCGYKVKIYHNKQHIYLKDNKNRILDLYWQPLGLHLLTPYKDHYTKGVEILPLDLWHSYDTLRFLLRDKNIRFIFKDGLISTKLTLPIHGKEKRLFTLILNGGELYSESDELTTSDEEISD
jgi:hypothetical protein